MTREEGAAWKALMEKLAHKPEDVRLRVTERAAILIYDAGLSPAEADERALAEEAKVPTQRRLEVA